MNKSKVLLIIIAVALFSAGILVGAFATSSGGNVGSAAPALVGATSSGNSDAGDPTTSSKDSDSALKAVLDNKLEFYSVKHDRSMNASEYYTLGGDFGPYKAFGYWVVDLDQDGVSEIVVDTGDRLVLRYEKGVVYGYTFGIRSMDMLRTDGSFFGSNGADVGMFIRITKFDGKTFKEELLGEYNESNGERKIMGNSVSKAEFDQRIAELIAKDFVEIINLSKENIKEEAATDTSAAQADVSRVTPPHAEVSRVSPDEYAVELTIRNEEKSLSRVALAYKQGDRYIVDGWITLASGQVEKVVLHGVKDEDVYIHVAFLNVGVRQFMSGVKEGEGLETHLLVHNTHFRYVLYELGEAWTPSVPDMRSALFQHIPKFYRTKKGKLWFNVSEAAG